MKKKFVLGLLILISCFTFFACKSDKKVIKLDTPTNLVVEDQYISFNEVDNASYYTINYDGYTVTIKPSNSGVINYNADKLFTQAKTYEVKVKAVGLDNYLDSAYTKVVKYTRTEVFEAPTVKLNNEVLTWGAINGATYYTIKVTYPDVATPDYYTYRTNSLDIKPFFAEVGSYKFQVKAGKEEDNNDYSAEVSYVYKKELDTPAQIGLEHDVNNNEIYLHFVADENSYDYIINVNNTDYILTNAYLDKYFTKNGFDNLYKVKLLSFLKSQNVNVDNLSNLAVTVTARSSGTDNYLDSAVSCKAHIQLTKVLTTPQAKVNKNELSWNSVVGANGYIVYKNLSYFATLKANETSITFDADTINNNVFHVQAEGVDTNVNSLLSNSITSSVLLANPAIQFSNGEISWTNINDCKYYLEIYNAKVCKHYILEDNRFSLEGEFNFDKYYVRLRYITSENKISDYSEKSINYTKKLDTPKNVTIGNSFSRYIVSFEHVEGAMGYAVNLNGTDIKVYTSNSIDLTDEISPNREYVVKIKAIALPGSNVESSDYLNCGSIKHATKLKAPAIKVIDGVLTFPEVENAQKYNILVNYTTIYEGGIEYLPEYDLNDILVSAQRYTVMVQALADSENSEYLDSDYASIIVPKYIQLDTINKEDITVTSNDGKYLLNFSTQTHAANYDIRIVHLDSGEEKPFNISYVPYDITNYIKNRGRYNIYVKAIANDDINYLYLSASESGIPYLLEKDRVTLTQVTNIKVGDKTAGSNILMLNWDIVEFADSYYINIYYRPDATSQNSLLEAITSTTNSINLGEYLKKEGNYTFKVKAVSSSGHEASAFSTSMPYNYIMTIDSDFKRNEVFMNGKYYSHYITSFDQLKNVMWHYYLFDQQSYVDADLSSEYKFKLMLGTTIETLETECAQQIAGFTTNSEDTTSRLHNLCKFALNSYHEGVLLKEDFATPINIDKAGVTYYLCNIDNGLKDDKLDTANLTKTYTHFAQKINLIPEVLRRNDNYIYHIDTLEKVDVVTTEQLFMVVQGGKAPNFVNGSAVAQTVYNNAKNVLKTIINDQMTDYEKVVAIYDWLVANVEYNYDFEQLMIDNPNLDDYTDINQNTIIGDCMYNYLEGVFYSNNPSATANGFAKAFVLLCKIEGIDAIKINGTKSGNKHYWNKVYLDVTPNNETNDPCWLTVDIASSFRNRTIGETKFMLPTYSYFLVTDAKLTGDLSLREVYTPNKNAQAVTKGNYYNNSIYSYNKQMLKNGASGVSVVTYTGSGTLQYQTTITEEAYILDVLKYMAYNCQLDSNMSITTIAYSYALELDMSVSSTALDVLVANITSSYYGEISTLFNCSFKIDATSYDGKILIAITPT